VLKCLLPEEEAEQEHSGGIQTSQLASAENGLEMYIVKEVKRRPVSFYKFFAGSVTISRLKEENNSGFGRCSGKYQEKS
jgi:hypothetical protein